VFFFCAILDISLLMLTLAISFLAATVSADIFGNATLPPLPPFSGYVVTAQWDGRTVPTVQWALDVTRQDTEYRFHQEFHFQQLIPTTPGNALSPTYTAYDEDSRVYFTTAARNDYSASLWGSQFFRSFSL
jgi:hypothetical protein